jgi:hypothetical protein
MAAAVVGAAAGFLVDDVRYGALFMGATFLVGQSAAVLTVRLVDRWKGRERWPVASGRHVATASAAMTCT